jgi:hypothetical protein
MRCFAFTLVMLSLALPVWAAGGEPLIFRDQARGIREQQLLEFFKNEGQYNTNLPYKIAAVDLNGDGVEEWIFRQNDSPACQANADCRFAIGGLSDGQLTLLGEMRGGKIGVAGEKLYGVRKLLVYNEKNDDFSYQTYVWTPDQRAFAPE